ncbi:hypothetical protein [Halostella salina]|uniref:hypothetical protein n=1 Tax=Halostella salina TaxID=1547897 RepID=UPI000EF846B9|nr:hypothetical protein [Halostella salina]
MTNQKLRERIRETSRRRFIAAMGAAAGTSLAGCNSPAGDGTDTATDTNTTAPPTTDSTTTSQPEQQEDPPEPGERITSARRIGPRDVSDFGFKELWTYRKRQAVEALVADPEVNDLASDWVASFEAYDPLTNRLDAISVQGTTGMTVDGGRESGTFEVTATDRQVAYGLVDRRTDELIGLHITEPTDVTWQRGDWNETQRARHEFVLNKDEVWQHLEGNEWYPMVKAAEIITAYEDYPHGEVSNVIYYVMDGDQLNVVSGFIHVAGEELELLDLNVVEDFVEHPIMEMARDTDPPGESVLGEVPIPPMQQRPQITAPNGYHRIEEPSETIEQDGWTVEWSGPRTVGAEVSASFNGTPVFSLTAPFSTSTGYDLPERNGRNTREFMFPTDEPVFSGELLFWDIHSLNLGGPGILGKTEYPSEAGRPGGFNLRTHYHTGAVQNARDFHSGHRFAPYNYYINYQFYEDGVFMPVWMRQGPGYVTEFYSYREREHDGPAQYYLENWVTMPTPGTTDGVETRVFDGDEWQTPESEFYLQGDEETVLRFTNPDGPETIDVPLDDMKEAVVVRPKEGEIGEALRVLDPEAELAFYHPAQYVDGGSIQGENVVFWLLMEGRTDEVPHSAGMTTYTQMAEFNLSGY